MGRARGELVDLDSAKDENRLSEKLTYRIIDLANSRGAIFVNNLNMSIMTMFVNSQCCIWSINIVRASS